MSKIESDSNAADIPDLIIEEILIENGLCGDTSKEEHNSLTYLGLFIILKSHNR